MATLPELHGYKTPDILIVRPSPAPRPTPYAPTYSGGGGSQGEITDSNRPVVSQVSTQPQTSNFSSVTGQSQQVTPTGQVISQQDNKPKAIVGLTNTVQPSSYSFGDAVIQSGKNVFNFGVIGEQRSFGAYFENIVEPFKYAGKTKRESEIGYNQYPKYRGTSSSQGYSGAFIDTTKMTYGELQSRKELESGVPLEYVGLSPSTIATRKAEKLQKKYESQASSDFTKINNYYQNQANEGKVMLIPSSSGGYELDPVSQSLYQADINAAIKKNQAGFESEYTKSTGSILNKKSAVESSLYTDADRVMGWDLDTRSGEKVRSLGPAVLEAGAITGAVAFGGPVIAGGAGVYLIGAGVKGGIEAIGGKSFDTIGKPEAQKMTLGQRAITAGLGAASAVVGGKILSNSVSRLGASVNEGIRQDIINKRNADIIKQGGVKGIRKEYLGTNKFQDFYGTKTTLGESELIVKTSVKGARVGKVQLGKAYTESTFTFRDFNSQNIMTVSAKESTQVIAKVKGRLNVLRQFEATNDKYGMVIEKTKFMKYDVRAKANDELRLSKGFALKKKDQIFSARLKGNIYTSESLIDSPDKSILKVIKIKKFGGGNGGISITKLSDYGNTGGTILKKTNEGKAVGISKGKTKPGTIGTGTIVKKAETSTLNQITNKLKTDSDVLTSTQIKFKQSAKPKLKSTSLQLTPSRYSFVSSPITREAQAPKYSQNFFQSQSESFRSAEQFRQPVITQTLNPVSQRIVSQPRPSYRFDTPRYKYSIGGGAGYFPKLNLGRGLGLSPRRGKQPTKYTPSLTGSILNLKGRGLKLGGGYAPFGRGIGTKRKRRKR